MVSLTQLCGGWNVEWYSRKQPSSRVTCFLTQSPVCSRFHAIFSAVHLEWYTRGSSSDLGNHAVLYELDPSLPQILPCRTHSNKKGYIKYPSALSAPGSHYIFSRSSNRSQPANIDPFDFSSIEVPSTLSSQFSIVRSLASVSTRAPPPRPASLFLVFHIENQRGEIRHLPYIWQLTLPSVSRKSEFDLFITIDLDSGSPVHPKSLSRVLSMSILRDHWWVAIASKPF